MKATMLIMFTLSGSPQVATTEHNSMYDCLRANVQITESIFEKRIKPLENEKRRCVPGSNFKLHQD